MPKKAVEYWTIKNVDIPVHIYTERRKSNRIAIGRDKVILRLPQFRATVLYDSYKKWGYNWLVDQTTANPSLLDRFRAYDYHNGSIIKTAYKSYTLQISHEQRKTNTAALVEDSIIHCKLSDQIHLRDRPSIIQKLSARTIATDSLTTVREQIHRLNDAHFGKKINAIKIKNTKSNWGSCSNNGNINISVRTLFAPLEVQRYIFIHELAHLIELNHSRRYWQLVERAMPDYREQEQWLHHHATTDFFRP